MMHSLMINQQSFKPLSAKHYCDSQRLHAAAAASCHGTSEVYRSMCAQFEAVDPQDEPKYSLEKDLARTFPAERTLINSATGAAALRRVVGCDLPCKHLLPCRRWR